TPTGQMVVDFLRGKMIGSIDTGLNIVHVRDVARGHILAADRGRIGEKYVLGHRNLSLLEIFRALADLTGLPPPRFRVPDGGAGPAACERDGARRVRGSPPAVPLNAVRMGRKRMSSRGARPARGRDFPKTPAENALRDAVTWFVERGYAPRPPKAA